MADLGDLSRLDSGWEAALDPLRSQLNQLDAFLASETLAGRQVLPDSDRVLAAFEQPMHSVKVLIIGQDPYPTPGHAVGLSFAVNRNIRPLPRSLQNIYRELTDDLGINAAEHGDLTSWSSSGVLLLNRVLTVEAGKPASHRRKGWEEVTELAIRSLVVKKQPLVAVLWGNEARALKPLFGSTPVIESAHPSPLSASRGFLGSKPFSRANEFLRQMGVDPIDWQVR